MKTVRVNALILMANIAFVALVGWSTWSQNSPWKSTSDGIYYNGNAIIGGKKPLGQLHIKNGTIINDAYPPPTYADNIVVEEGNYHAGMSFRTSAAYKVYINFGSDVDVDNGWIQYIIGIGAMQLRAGNKDMVRIKNNGVKIGLSTDPNPYAMLDVDGDMILRSFSVPASPVKGHIYFIASNSTDPDTMAFYDGTTWKYFISQ